MFWNCFASWANLVVDCLVKSARDVFLSVTHL